VAWNLYFSFQLNQGNVTSSSKGHLCDVSAWSISSEALKTWNHVLAYRETSSRFMTVRNSMQTARVPSSLRSCYACFQNIHYLLIRPITHHAGSLAVCCPLWSVLCSTSSTGSRPFLLDAVSNLCLTWNTK
jgi:hypothetical protein